MFGKSVFCPCCIYAIKYACMSRFVLFLKLHMQMYIIDLLNSFAGTWRYGVPNHTTRWRYPHWIPGAAGRWYELRSYSERRVLSARTFTVDDRVLHCVVGGQMWAESNSTYIYWIVYFVYIIANPVICGPLKNHQVNAFDFMKVL